MAVEISCRSILNVLARSKAAVESDWYMQVRAVVARTFPAYDFEAIDRLDVDDVIEVYAAALWIGEQEAKQVKKASSRRRRGGM